METDVGGNDFPVVEILNFREEGEEYNLCRVFGGRCRHSG